VSRQLVLTGCLLTVAQLQPPSWALRRGLGRSRVASLAELGRDRPLGTALTVLYRLLGPEGREYLEEAERVLAGSGYNWNLAWVRAEKGALLRRENQAGAARELLEQALDYATRQGVEPLSTFAERELRLTGARPRRRLLTGVESLTPAEQRIAHVVAEGATNREVAQQLFLTVKTIESHLAHVYRKVDIASVEATAGDCVSWWRRRRSG
jgi:DNA-binding CsgD family transcriptional regulator